MVCQPVPALQVAKVLVLLHNELLQGSAETLERLRRQAPAGVSGSQQQKVSPHRFCHVLCTVAPAAARLLKRAQSCRMHGVSR